MELLDAVRVLVCTYNPPPRSSAVLLFANASWLSVIEDNNIAYTPPPVAPAALPSMELLDTVRVLACTYNPPAQSAAVLLLADAPCMSVMEADSSVYTPPPEFALLPSMELLDTVRVLAPKYNPPPQSAAVLLFADAPCMSVMEADNSVYTPPT